MPKRKSPKKAATFEESFKKLEETVRLLEAGNLTLEETTALLEQGTKLAAECRQILETTEIKVRYLKENFAQQLSIIGKKSDVDDDDMGSELEAQES